MEYAIMLTSLESFKNVSDKYTRVYYGDAFCPRLQFNLEQIKRLVDNCEVRGKDLTLVTSYMTEENIEKLDEILIYLKKCEKKCEIVVNDWGGIYYLKNEYLGDFDLILGRLLNKIKKSPIISNIYKKLNKDSQTALQTASSNFPASWELYSKYGISKVEFENTIQENRFAKNYPLMKTLIYPYVFISNSRRCFTDYIMKDNQEYDIGSCNKYCESMELNLFNKVMCRDVVLKGSTYYYINTVLPSNLEEYSRIVIQDNVPLDIRL